MCVLGAGRERELLPLHRPGRGRHGGNRTNPCELRSTRRAIAPRLAIALEGISSDRPGRHGRALTADRCRNPVSHSAAPRRHFRPTGRSQPAGLVRGDSAPPQATGSRLQALTSAEAVQSAIRTCRKRLLLRTPEPVSGPRSTLARRTARDWRVAGTGSNRAMGAHPWHTVSDRSSRPPAIHVPDRPPRERGYRSVPTPKEKRGSRIAEFQVAKRRLACGVKRVHAPRIRPTTPEEHHPARPGNCDRQDAWLLQTSLAWPVLPYSSTWPPCCGFPQD